MEALRQQRSASGPLFWGHARSCYQVRSSLCGSGIPLIFSRIKPQADEGDLKHSCAERTKQCAADEQPAENSEAEGDGREEAFGYLKQVEPSQAHPVLGISGWTASFRT